jgi:hypothetical protein
LEYTEIGLAKVDDEAAQWMIPEVDSEKYSKGLVASCERGTPLLKIAVTWMSESTETESAWMLK